MATQNTATQNTRKAQPNMRDLLLPGLAPSPELAKLRQFAIGLRPHQQGTFIAAVNTAYMKDSDLESARVAGYETLAARELAIREAAAYKAADDSAVERWLAAVLNHPLLNQMFVDGVKTGVEQGIEILRKATASDKPVFKRAEIDAWVAEVQSANRAVAHNFGISLVFAAIRQVLSLQKKQKNSARVVDLSRNENFQQINDLVDTVCGRLLDSWKARGARIREAAIAFDAQVERAYVQAVAAEGANALAAANPLGASLRRVLLDTSLAIQLAEGHTGVDSAGNALNGTEAAQPLVLEVNQLVAAAA